MIRCRFNVDYPVYEAIHKDKELAAKANRSIMEKINEKTIELPFVPTKEMKVNLILFSDVFNFTDEEVLFMQDSVFDMVISDLIITPDYLIVALD